VTRWPAPVAPGPLHGVVRVPGSKSATARALVLAGLAAAGSSLRGVLESRDTRLMQAGLASLGAGFESDGVGLRVEPIREFVPGARIDCGLAGTVMRFLPPVAALGRGVTHFTGDPQASARPIAPLLAALGQLGVRASGVGAGGESGVGDLEGPVPRHAGVSGAPQLPFDLDASARTRGGVVTVDASGSSQFVSGLLLAGARFEDGLTVVNCGADLPSRPHVDMTVAMLRARGVRVDANADSWTIHPGPISGADEWIEPDLTNTATFLAAALVAGGELEAAWPADSVQPGDELLAALAAFGASVTLVDHPLGTPSQTVRVSGELHGADVDLRAISEFTPVAAALAALANSPSVITGVGHIRGHETDRLAALGAELAALGADVRELPDGLAITPRPLRPTGIFHTYGDHRMAHAAALIGLVTPGIVIDDIGVTTKTLADFPGMWRTLVEHQ